MRQVAQKEGTFVKFQSLMQRVWRQKTGASICDCEKHKIVKNQNTIH